MLVFMSLVSSSELSHDAAMRIWLRDQLEKRLARHSAYIFQVDLLTECRTPTIGSGKAIRRRHRRYHP